MKDWAPRMAYDIKQKSASEKNLAETFDELIKQLRAYAVIACGCKATADAALMKVCNRLVELNADFSIEPSLDTRTFLYGMVEEQISHSSLATKSIDSKLFVLIGIEGVSPSDAASILGLDHSFVLRWAQDVLR